MRLFHRTTTKTVSAYFLALVFSLTFASCGGDKDENKGKNGSVVENCTLETGTLDNCTLE